MLDRSMQTQTEREVTIDNRGFHSYIRGSGRETRERKGRGGRGRETASVERGRERGG